MAYQALYRVWRPQLFHDVVGQEHITKTIQHAIINGKLTHAYLFTGPRGTGKTSAAKIIAKAINCKHAPTLEPCNECEACRSITEGRNPDVIEMDAASNNSVEDIRDIRDKVKFAPSTVKYKVYIIDEVHMLSIGAFNALLKTLEEPPGHVIFILATTEPHKIPITIISRCQRFDFKRITVEQMVARMREITETNKVTIEDNALQLVARSAEGGMRDALSLLDQAISYSDEAVTENDVLAIIGGVSQTFLAKMIDQLANQDVASLLESVDYIINEGKDPLRFIEDLVYYYRDLLLYKTLPNIQEHLLNYQLDENFIALANKLSTEDIYSVIEQLNASQREIKWTTHPKIFLEMTLIKLCQKEGIQTTGAGDNEQISSLYQKISELESKIEVLSKQGISNIQIEETKQVDRRKPKVHHNRRKVPTATIKELLTKATKQELNHLRNGWPEILKSLGKQSVQVHAWMKEGKPVLCSKDELLLSFPYELHAEKAGEDKNRRLLEQMIFQKLGFSMQVITVFADDWESIKKEYLHEQQEQGHVKEEDPLVVEGKKLVGDQLIEIKD